MNTKQTKSRSMLLLAMLLIVSIISGWAAKPESVKKKEISKSFDLNKGDMLMTDNRYGNTTITHWNKNEASIRVEIEVKTRSDEAAQKVLDRIQVELKKTGDTVSAVTSLKQQNWSGNGNQNERFTINYFISIPSKLDINLSQKYGNINLPDKNEGRSTIQVKYGNLNAGSFTQLLTLQLKYGNMEINDVAKANLDLGYCGNAVIRNAEQLYADNKYSNMEIKNCKQIDLENKYGNVKMGSVGKANMEIKYSEISIGSVSEGLEVGELAYSTLSIKDLSPNFKYINVDARYGNLNIYIPSNASFKVAAENLKYGNHSIGGFNDIEKRTEDKVNHYYEVNGGKNGKIHFDANNYSNIKVKAL